MKISVCGKNVMRAAWRALKTSIGGVMLTVVLASAWNW